MPVSAWLAGVAGAPPVRSVVNAAFHVYSRRRVAAVASANPVQVQERTLHALLRRARATRFGLDHRFAAIRSVNDFQRAVPLRTYEDLWNSYLREQYPVFDNLTWPGRVPYLALTSGTTQGATKYIPVTREMIASNLRGSKTMVAHLMVSRPASRLFHGRMFFLGGSTNLEQPAPGLDIRQGDLSGIMAREAGALLRPYTFPPLELALETDWDKKLTMLAERSLREPVTVVGGVPSWLLVLFERLFALSGKTTVAEIWPKLEAVVHGGVKFDPYREAFAAAIGNDKVQLQDAYACSEGFVAFGDTADGRLRLVFDNDIFYEFVPADELESTQPERHWLGNVQLGVNYAIVVSTCAGMWAHIIGDTVRFESLSPPLLTFTGRTKYTLSAFGEHLISEEIEAAMAAATACAGGQVREWHVGTVFQGALGYHQYVMEFLKPPADLTAFRSALDADLIKRNADYQAHRSEGVGLPLPALAVAKPGGFADWMRSRGKLGGQNKVPRMDAGGTLTAELLGYLRAAGALHEELAPGNHA